MSKNDSTIEVISNAIELLCEKDEEIYRLWMQQQMSSCSLRLDLISKGDLEEQSQQFMDTFFIALSHTSSEGMDSKEFQHVTSLLVSISRSRAIQGFTPSETAMFVFSFKEVCIKVLQVEFETDAIALMVALNFISQIIDKLGLQTFEAFSSAREDLAREQSDTILSMATPITTIWDQILLLPIIGTIDSKRAQSIMESMLNKISQMNSKVIVMDVLGVAAIDSSVAQHLIKISQATELMGCRCIITGISPQIAQAIVNLGLDLGGIMSTSTLKDGLKIALEHLDLEIVSKKV